MKVEKILVVHRRSTYTDLVSEQKHAKITQLIKTGDPLVDGIVAAHKNHTASMQKVKKILKDRGLSATWRHRIGELRPDDFDLVVAVGGDGTVLHASHAIGKTPVLAVNSSPSTSVGFFTGADAARFDQVLDQVISGAFRPITLCRMKVEVGGRVVTDRVLNDVLFCHACPASTTRYRFSFDGRTESQVSSGVWVSTAAGSTGGIRSAGGKVMPPRSRRLQFVVREPNPSGDKRERRAPRMIHGFVPDKKLFKIRSKTDAARLYIDGPHLVFPVDFGDEVTLSKSDSPLHLFGYNQKDK
jgi:NAD+ kinase